MNFSNNISLMFLSTSWGTNYVFLSCWTYCYYYLCWTSLWCFKTLHILIAFLGMSFHSLPLVSFFGYIYMISAVVWLSHFFLNDVQRGNIWHKLKGMPDLWLSSIFLFVLPKDSEYAHICSDDMMLWICSELVKLCSELWYTN